MQEAKEMIGMKQMKVKIEDEEKRREQEGEEEEWGEGVSSDALLRNSLFKCGRQEEKLAIAQESERA